MNERVKRKNLAKNTPGGHKRWTNCGETVE